MTSSPNETAIPSPLAAISLKLVGAITIAAALIDFLTLLFPPDFGNRAWQLATVTSLVDRGIVPLVGIALLFTGYWIDTSLGKSARRASLVADARFWTCLLSCLLGLTFLLTTVLHPNNVRIQSRDALTQVETEAQQATSELEGRLNADLSERRAQIDALLENEDQLQA
ncbi:MAG: HpsJ family protein, partial [Cyanobacteria bacterium J06623_5]